MSASVKPEVPRHKKKKKKASSSRKRGVRGEKNSRPSKRHQVDLTKSVELDTNLYELEVADVPGPADLLDQVLATAGGCTSIGGRAELAFEPDPVHIRAEVQRFVAASKQALKDQDEEDARRRKEGACIPRRSKYFDDVTPDPDPDPTFTVIPQRWAPQAPPDAGAEPPRQGPPEVPAPRVFVTHQAIGAISVTFEARPPMDVREEGTGSFSHILRVRLDTGGSHNALEVRYLLHEYLVHEIRDGPIAIAEDAKQRKSTFMENTWLDDIPFVIAARGCEYEPFFKRMEIRVPGGCDDVISEDLLILKQAMRIHHSPDAASNSIWELCRTKVYVTSTFHGALTASLVSDAEAKLYRLRWLQLTPFGPMAYRANNANHKMDQFYDSDNE